MEVWKFPNQTQGCVQYVRKNVEMQHYWQCQDLFSVTSVFRITWFHNPTAQLPSHHVIIHTWWKYLRISSINPCYFSLNSKPFHTEIWDFVSIVCVIEKANERCSSLNFAVVLNSFPPKKVQISKSKKINNTVVIVLFDPWVAILNQSVMQR